jgi:hypothetical protein
MLQVAFAGSFLVSENENNLVSTPVYYEPGFNIISPLELSISKSDRFYILLRKRDNDSGTSFTNLDKSNISISTVDVTNGEEVLSIVSDNDLNSAWDAPSGNLPLVLIIENQIDILNPEVRVRVVDCYVNEIGTNNFIKFRVTVEDDNLYFNYIPVDRKALSDRNTFTIEGRQAYVKLNSDSDSYIIFSPFAWLKETTNKDIADFSYPQDSIFYQRENTYNKEDFSFSLSAYSNSFIAEQISVMNIPGYKKAGIILIDNMLYRHLIEQGRSAYADISVVGELSNITDTFRVNFTT